VPHQLREAILTRVLTAFHTSIRPPLTVEMDDLTYSKGVPRISQEPGAVNPLRLNRHKLGQVPYQPDMNIASALMGAVDEGRSRMMLPNQAHGNNQHSNVAGYATNVLNTAGLKKIVAHEQTLEEFEGDCMELRLKLYRDFGHLVRQGRDGPYGEVLVPRADPMPDEDMMFTLTPGDLRRTGIQMACSLSTLPVHMLGPLANVGQMLMNMGVWDEYDVHRLIGTPNPHKSIARIRMNKVLNDDAMVWMQTLKALVDNGMVAEAAFLAHAKALAGGGGGAGPQPQGGMMAPSGGGSPVGTVVGDSNAQYGLGPGPGSGPPPGLMIPSDPGGVEP
jgi:hypothetical protein